MPARGSAPARKGLRARELGVVIQDLSLETLECGAGIDPELVDEPCAGLLEGLKRVCLPSRAVEREHQLSAQSLAERVIDDEALEPGDDLRVPAELELSLDLLLDHRESELFEPHRPRGPRTPHSESRDSGSPRKSASASRSFFDRADGPSARAAATTRSKRSSCPAHRRPQAAAGIQAVVSRSARLRAACAAPRCDRAAPSEQSPAGAGPTTLDQIVDRDDLALAQQQESEQRTLLRPHRREIDAVGVHLEPAEKPELHLVTSVTRQSAR